MKTTILIPTEVELKYVKMNLAVRYDEEDIPNDYPFREGDMWNILVEIDTGKIVDWPKGIEPREVYMKVCDQGNYFLLREDMAEVLSIEQDYVPNNLVPGKYGDYIDFKIDENGVITNWYKEPSLHDFKNEDD